MNIHQTTDLDSFRQHALPFLRQRPAEHHLLLGLLESLEQSSDHPQAKASAPILITVEHDRAVVAVAMQTATRPLVLSKTTKPAYVEAIAHHIKSRWPSRAVPLRQSLSSFGGPKAEAAIFAQALRRWTRLRYKVSLAMRIYQLHAMPYLGSASPHGATAGQLRPANRNDRYRLIQWCRAFDQESFGEVRTDPIQWTDRNLAAAQLYLWETSDGPVCLVAGSGNPSDGGRIGPIYTPPEHRRRGYGTAATAALSQQLLKENCIACYLFVDVQNETANHIYQAIGYEAVCDWDEYEFRC